MFINTTEAIWVPVWMAIVAIIPGVISAIASALDLRQTAKLKKQVILAHGKIDELERNTNNKMDKLLEAKDALRESTNKSSFAEGVIEGKKDV